MIVSVQLVVVVFVIFIHSGNMLHKYAGGLCFKELHELDIEAIEVVLDLYFQSA